MTRQNEEAHTWEELVYKTTNKRGRGRKPKRRKTKTKRRKTKTKRRKTEMKMQEGCEDVRGNEECKMGMQEEDAGRGEKR